jgi:hypothetical protein
MREATLRDLENNAYWLKPEEHDELRRLKKDFYAEVSDRNAHPTLVIPGHGWQIRGPLTIAQVEQESLEHLQKSPRKDVPLVPFGSLNKEWTELKNKYQNGDELYFYRSDQRSWRDLCGTQGYVLIRGNEEIGGIVTLMN